MVMAASGFRAEVSHEKFAKEVMGDVRKLLILRNPKPSTATPAGRLYLH
jgi:hypothetical protein